MNNTPMQPLSLAQLEFARDSLAAAAGYVAAGEYTAAIQAYQCCLSSVPDLPEAQQGLAFCLGASGQYQQAVDLLTPLVKMHPGLTTAGLLLAKAWLKLGDAKPALQEIERLLINQPDSFELLRCKAEALYRLQRYDQARHLADQLLQQMPDDYGCQLLLAGIERTGSPEHALQLYRRLIEQYPKDDNLQLYQATLLLSLGRLEQGWVAFEHRIPSLQLSPDILVLPRWHNGLPLAGRTIVVVAEQGHGDAIQFIRFVPLLVAQGAQIMVLCHNEQIRPLLAGVAGVSAAVIPNEPLPFIPDYYCPLLSLPFEFSICLDNIPSPLGYLQPDRAKRQFWQERLDRLSGLKVGLVWAGNRSQADNRYRSVPFDQLQVLLQLPGISFVSLQVGPDALKYQEPHGRTVQIWDPTDELYDFTDTAALVSCLDLVISICSSVTHLAGALGVPVWVMLQYDADWRWLRERTDSPWYSSARLFRQQQPGGWGLVMEQVHTALESLSGTCRRPFGEDAGTCYAAGVDRFSRGELDEAEQYFRRALSLGMQSEALNGLATIADQRGQYDQAAELYANASAVDPHNLIAQFNLANSRRKQGNLPEAEQLYRNVVQQDAGFAPAWAGLGNLLLAQQRTAEAEECLKHAVHIQPDNPDALCDLGILNAAMGDVAGAESTLRRAVEADPGHLAALNQLGMLLMKANRLEEAEIPLLSAIKRKADYWQALNNLGVLYHWWGKLPEAEACQRRFIAAAPGNGTPHYNLALVLLSQGRFTEGWQEYEWRFYKDDPVPVRHDDLPRWQGEKLTAGRILIHAEQGYGDTIQFARYLPGLVQQGMRIVLECQDRIIAPLFEQMPGIEAVIARGEALPEVAAACPLLSLPAVLGDAAASEPVSINYLTADPVRTTAWQCRLEGLTGYRVGLVWSGRRGQDNNHNRMIPPGLVARLGSVQGVSFINLLVGIDDPVADAALAPLHMYDARPYLKEFAESAALVACLDLLISVDTATAHLAGALGAEAWVMIPYNADWRWTFGLPACPLYPSVRLYRQQHPFAWEPVVDAVCRDLAKRVEQYASQKKLEAARQAADEQQWERALQAYQASLVYEPDNAEVLLGIGACLQMQNKPVEALDWYDHALIHRPDDSVLHCNRALALLTLGRYEEGWQELQWRKTMIRESLPPIPFLTPADLPEISGKRLLLHAEQGFGDTIQMLRYLPLLADQGARLILSLPRPLVRLAALQPVVYQAVAHGDPLPVCDCQALFQDLPWLFRTTLETVPVQTPYLELPEHLSAHWRQQVGQPAAIKVGIAWACGGTDPRNRAQRSLQLHDLTPLFELSQIQFYSLQIGSDALTDQQRFQYANLHDLTHLVADFADTAALIQALDYVITVDTAVAHLAGALGKPVWLMLPSFREWRWAEREGRAVWYPAVEPLVGSENSEFQTPVVEAVARLKEVLSKKSRIENCCCRLCGADAAECFVGQRIFFLCPRCGLIFSDCPLSSSEIAEHYQSQHGTAFDDLEYARKIISLSEGFTPVTRILDYGSGAGRLAHAFRCLGYRIDCYEPMTDGLFGREQYSDEYDLIVINEVIEHVYEINTLFKNALSVCKSGGILYIGTLTTDNIINCPDDFKSGFGNWWYKDDLTHVSFFCLSTFIYICGSGDEQQLDIVGYGTGGVLLKKR